MDTGWTHEVSRTQNGGRRSISGLTLHLHDSPTALSLFGSPPPGMLLPSGLIPTCLPPTQRRTHFPPPGQRTSFWYVGPPVSCSSWDLTPFSLSSNDHPPIMSHSLSSFPHRQKSGKYLPSGLFLRVHSTLRLASACGRAARHSKGPVWWICCSGLLPSQELLSLRSPVAPISPHPTDTSALIFLDSATFDTVDNFLLFATPFSLGFFHSTNQSFNGYFLSTYCVPDSGDIP